MFEKIKAPLGLWYSNLIPVEHIHDQE